MNSSNATILDYVIQPLSVDSYQLTVYERLYDQLTTSQPLASVTFSHRVDFLTDFNVDRLNASTKDGAERFDELRELGEELYERLFTPAIIEIWTQYKQHSEFLVLCLRFAPDAAKLEVLPWETLHDGQEFIAAGSKTTLTRLPLEVTPTSQLSLIQTPLKFLALFSCPLDLRDNERLNAEREQEILIEAIDHLAGERRISADFEDEAKLEVLERTLRDGYHILHFTGHGISPRDGGGLLLEDTDGGKLHVSTDKVVQVMKNGIGSLRLAVISGCQTARTLHTDGFCDLSRALLRHGVPSVIAMQFSITDAGGLRFAEVLYREIGKGVELERAVHAARRVLLDDEKFTINSDALAIVLLTANGACLKTTAESAPPKSEKRRTQPGDDLDPLTHGFYGRRREYRAIRDGLLQRNRHAIVIHGIGGIGKTALLTHALNRLSKHFRGVVSFDCRRSMLVPETILVKLHHYFASHGLTQLENWIGQSLPPETLATKVAEQLTQWPLLIVFDNFETQLDERREIASPDLRAFLTTLIQATETGSRFLFTTRYLFEFNSSQYDYLQSLPLGDLSRAEATMLMHSLPNLARYRPKQAVLARFGGHPYALNMLDRLGDHYPLADAMQNADLLNTELREFLAIELNYRRLSVPARELLNRLAAFRTRLPVAVSHWVMDREDTNYPVEFLLQNWNTLRDQVEAAGVDEVLQSLDPILLQTRPNTDDSVRELIDWGLLTPWIATGTVQSFSIHGLVRDFCRSQQSSDEWRKRLHEAAEFFLDVSKRLERNEAETETWSEISESFTRGWTEIEAFELLFEASDFEGAAYVLGDAHRKLARGAHDRFLEEQYRKLLNRVDGPALALVLHNQAMTMETSGLYSQALEQHQRVLFMRNKFGDQRGVAHSLNQIGINYLRLGDCEMALDQFWLGLSIAQSIRDRTLECNLLNQIGMANYNLGDYDEALVHFRGSLALEHERGNLAGVAQSLINIARIHQEREDYEDALESYQEALTLNKNVGDRPGAASCLLNIGSIYLAVNEYALALEQLRLALVIKEELGDRNGIANVLHNVAIVHEECGDHGKALEQYMRSLEIFQDLGDKAGCASSLSQIGRLYTERGLYKEAFHSLFNSFSLFLATGSNKSEIARGNLNILRAKWGSRNFDAAWQEALKGLEAGS